MIDATASGTLMGKISETTYRLLEELPSNNCQWSSENARLKPMTGVLELNQISNLASQLVTPK